MDLYRAIESRTSTRKYSDQLVEQSSLEKFKLKLKNLASLNPDMSVRLEIVSEPKTVREIGIGFMGGHVKINAPHCIVGITEKKDKRLENIGFMLEQAVLDLQSQGISTCWLGTYNEEKVKSVFNISENEEVSIVIAFGYSEKAFYNNGMRKLFGTHKRKTITEICYYKGWGEDIRPYFEEAPKIKKILHMSSLYPSANNAQPIRVIIEEGKALFYAKMNNKSECYRIDAGIFMAHFYLSCIEEDFQPLINIDQEEPKNYNVPKDYVYIGCIGY